MSYNEFLKKGYIILNIPENKMSFLSEMKKKIKDKSQKFIQLKRDSEFELNKFHYYKLKKKNNLNDLRMEIMKEINNNMNTQKEIYETISDFLDFCLGPDIATQKIVNLVIQKPNDNERAPFHKDGPVASNYEVVLWVPLVDCYKTMNMYLFENKLHDRTKNFLKSNSNNQSLDTYSKKFGTLNSVKFGQILVFWTNVFHYIPVNKENDTRWSLNLRYKNLFTKYGTKNILDYYKILKISPITKMLQKIDV